MVIRKLVDYAIRTSGSYLIPRAYKAFRRYDIRTTNQLFGKSGGRGFRHGRDAGLALADFIRKEGDDLDPRPFQPKYSSRTKPQARNRYGKRSGPCRCNNYYPSNRRKRRSSFSSRY